jgi:hypothetical protein
MIGVSTQPERSTASSRRDPRRILDFRYDASGMTGSSKSGHIAPPGATG